MLSLNFITISLHNLNDLGFIATNNTSCCFLLFNIIKILINFCSIFSHSCGSHWAFKWSGLIGLHLIPLGKSPIMNAFHKWVVLTFSFVSKFLDHWHALRSRLFVNIVEVRELLLGNDIVMYHDSPTFHSAHILERSCSLMGTLVRGMVINANTTTYIFSPLI